MKIIKYKYNPNKAGVFRISVVPKPAVGEGDLVLMSAVPQEIKGVFYAPVMIPDLRIDRIDEKTGEKFQVYYDVETVEKLANNYFRQCGNRNTNLDHEKENTEGIYPVESWIVKDPENDKSKPLGMPLQKIGTWIMGYKADNPKEHKKIKNNLLQGLSIEGHLDAEEEVNVKFNKSIMKRTPLEFAKHLANVIMSAASDEEKPEKTAEELAAEEASKKVEMTAEEEAAKAKEEADKLAAGEKPEGGEASELETLKAENEELKKKVTDLEAEVAKNSNDAVLMSAQLEEVNTAFEAYKTVKMSSQSLADQRIEKPVLTDADVKHSKFLADVLSKI